MDKAFEHYRRALAIDPRHRGAHEYIGEAYLMDNKPDMAQQHLASLEKICGTTCEEYADLAKAIAAYTSKAAEQSTIEYIMHIVPSTVVGAFAEGHILQVLLFSVLFGGAVALLPVFAVDVLHVGAAGLGDIGALFPDTAAENAGRDSVEMLRLALARVEAVVALLHAHALVDRLGLRNLAARERAGHIEQDLALVLGRGRVVLDTGLEDLRVREGDVVVEAEFAVQPDGGMRVNQRVLEHG